MYFASISIQDSVSRRGICTQARNIVGLVADHDTMAIDYPRSNLNSPSPPPPQPGPTLCSRRFLTPGHKFFFKSTCPNRKINRFDCVAGSVEGWLFMVGKISSEGFTTFAYPWSHSLLVNHQPATVNYFLNPISGDRVILPSHTTIPSPGSEKSSFFKKVVASSAPTLSHCVVVGLCRQGRLAFCRPGDSSWTLMNEGVVRGVDFCDVEIIDGKLHAVLRKSPGFLIVFNIESDSDRCPAYFAEALFRFDPDS